MVSDDQPFPSLRGNIANEMMPIQKVVVDDYEINDAVIDKVKDYMRESISEMKELLCDKENNIAE